VSLRRGIALAVLAAALATPGGASAYPWMLRHEYSGCATCHADPSGGGLLTRYGRAQTELLMRTRYRAAPVEGEEPGRVAGFLFGAFELPERVLMQADFRGLGMEVWPGGGKAVGHALLMQADLAGQVAVGRVRGAASLGFANEGALGASISRGANRLIGRTYWLAVDLGDDRQWTIRGGRLVLPYGLRIIEHNTWVRSLTRTDLDATQQHGLAVSYSGPRLRGEAMAILGNYQVSPDAFRERGYSAYVEWLARPRLAVGATSLVTHAAEDAQLATPLWRHAHGAFARWAALSRLALLAEVDLLLWSQPPGTNTFGTAGILQADYEVTRGVHLMATGEVLDHTPDYPGAAAGAWGTVAWFFLPHADLRADVVWHNVPQATSRTSVTTLIGQLHLFF
jgi:hypothetical protein